MKKEKFDDIKKEEFKFLLAKPEYINMINDYNTTSSNSTNKMKFSGKDSSNKINFQNNRIASKEITHFNQNLGTYDNFSNSKNDNSINSEFVNKDEDFKILRNEENIKLKYDLISSDGKKNISKHTNYEITSNITFQIISSKSFYKLYNEIVDHVNSKVMIDNFKFSLNSNTNKNNISNFYFTLE